MTYYVSSGTLNPTHSLTMPYHSLLLQINGSHRHSDAYTKTGTLPKNWSRTDQWPGRYTERERGGGEWRDRQATDLVAVISEAWRDDDDDAAKRVMLSSHLSHSATVSSRQTATQATSPRPLLHRTVRYITTMTSRRHVLVNSRHLQHSIHPHTIELGIIDSVRRIENQRGSWPRRPVASHCTAYNSSDHERKLKDA